MPTVHVNGIEIYYQEHGYGYPVILTHGLGDCAELWSPLAEALALPGKGYRVIGWDMRGHYRSEAPEDLAQYTQDIVVEDLRALCDHLGIERAVHGGHSLGGYTALRFHEKYPQRVAALVLHGTGPGYRNPEGSQAWTDQLAKLADWQERNFERADRKPAKELRVGAPALGQVGQHLVRGVAGVERGIMAHPYFIDATKVDVPALLIVGENDKNYLASAEYFTAKLPNAKKLVVAGAGHPAILEQPEAVHAAVREFLDGLDL
ncbi:MAG: alpha/beta hydrolase [Dehalococcoidia bacterium]|nr:alpha/beta hydrolase [Dehalococcoidia bacterium]MDZ4278768.1 alpha/beta hydrolase [Dehalococcoidia bacterium]